MSMSFYDLRNQTLLNVARENIKNTEEMKKLNNKSPYVRYFSETNGYHVLPNNSNPYINTTPNMFLPKSLTGGGNAHNDGNKLYSKTAKSMLNNENIELGESLGSNLPDTSDDNFQTAKSSLELFFIDVVNGEFSNQPIKQQDIRQALGNLRLYGTNLKRIDLNRYSEILEEVLNGYLTRMEDKSNYFIEFYNDIKKTSKKSASDIQIYAKNLAQLGNQELLYKMFLIIQSLIETLGLTDQAREASFKVQYNEIIKAASTEIMPVKYEVVKDLSIAGMNEIKESFSNIYEKMEGAFKNLQKASTQRAEDIYTKEDDEANRLLVEELEAERPAMEATELERAAQRQKLYDDIKQKIQDNKEKKQNQKKRDRDNKAAINAKRRENAQMRREDKDVGNNVPAAAAAAGGGDEDRGFIGRMFDTFTGRSTSPITAPNTPAQKPKITRAKTPARPRTQSPITTPSRPSTRPSARPSTRANTALRPLETPTRPITDFNFITYDEVNDKADKLVGNAKIFPKFWKKAYWDSLK